MIQTISIYGVFWLALLLMPAAATAYSFNYEYLQVDADGSITTLNSRSGKLDFGAKFMNLDIQILPANNLYLRTGTVQASF